MIIGAQFSLPVHESKLISPDLGEMETQELLSRLVVDMHLGLPSKC